MPNDWMQYLLPGAAAGTQALNQWPFGPNPILAGLAGFSGARTAAEEEEERRRKEEEERLLRDQERQLRLLQIASTTSNPAIAAAMADLFATSDPGAAEMFRTQGQTVREREMEEEAKRRSQEAAVMGLIGRMGAQDPTRLSQMGIGGPSDIRSFPGGAEQLFSLILGEREAEEERERKAKERQQQLKATEAAERRAAEYRMQLGVEGERLRRELPAAEKVPTPSDPLLARSRSIRLLKDTQEYIGERAMELYLERGGPTDTDLLTGSVRPTNQQLWTQVRNTAAQEAAQAGGMTGPGVSVGVEPKTADELEQRLRAAGASEELIQQAVDGVNAGSKPEDVWRAVLAMISGG